MRKSKRGHFVLSFSGRAQKRGISVMVGYILLVVFAMGISVGVYQWLKSFVPEQSLECPEGVSAFLESASFDAGTRKLTIEVVNNGRFNIAGYFIHATNKSEQELPTIDLSVYLNKDESSAEIFAGSVLFISGSGNNPFNPGERETHVFDLPEPVGTPYNIRIIPTRQQEVSERVRFVSCSNVRSEQSVG